MKYSISISAFKQLFYSIFCILISLHFLSFKPNMLLTTNLNKNVFFSLFFGVWFFHLIKLVNSWSFQLGRQVDQIYLKPKLFIATTITRFCSIYMYLSDNRSNTLPKKPLKNLIKSTNQDNEIGKTTILFILYSSTFSNFKFSFKNTLLPGNEKSLKFSFKLI
jgi:hypothetical protein